MQLCNCENFAQWTMVTHAISSFPSAPRRPTITFGTLLEPIHIDTVGEYSGLNKSRHCGKFLKVMNPYKLKKTKHTPLVISLGRGQWHCNTILTGLPGWPFSPYWPSGPRKPFEDKSKERTIEQMAREGTETWLQQNNKGSMGIKKGRRYSTAVIPRPPRKIHH